VLTKAGYYTRPAFQAIKEMNIASLTQVNDFAIGNEFGEISFIGPSDLTFVNFDRDIDIQKKQFLLYMDEQHKPLKGTKLNKPAIISIFNYLPKKLSEPSQETESKMRQFCKKLDATFLSYSYEENTLQVQVENF